MNRPYQQPGQGSREQRRAAQREATKRDTGLAYGIGGAAPLGPQTHSNGSHMHAEAFCLMWYACECGHRERIWNSRDGVTPFGFACPSCNEPKLSHVDWGRDTYAPGYTPAIGQRIWIDMTRDRAKTIAQRTVDRVAKQMQVPAHDLNRIAETVFNGGGAPDLVIWGYVEAP